MKKQYMFVAVADVLGFKKIVETRYKDVLKLADAYVKFLSGAHTEAQALHVSPSTHKEGALDILGGMEPIPHGVFSDTILLWLPAPAKPVNNSKQINSEYGLSLEPELLALSRSVASLILVGLQKHFPLRIGIAFGECVIEPHEGIYLGQAIVDAHLLGEDQNWMGVAYHSSCSELFSSVSEERKRALLALASIIEYLVPLKSEEPIPGVGRRTRWTADWPAFAFFHDINLDDIQKCLNKFKRQAPPETKKKWDNTLKFFHRCRNESTK